MFMAREEIIELTGYKRPSLQIAQLKRYGLRFFLAADGHPRVLKSDLEGVKRQAAKSPDFSALPTRG